MSDFWGQHYLRWVLAEHGYDTYVIPSDTYELPHNNPEKRPGWYRAWSSNFDNQWLTVEFNSVTDYPAQEHDAVMYEFSKCETFRDFVQRLDEEATKKEGRVLK